MLRTGLAAPSPASGVHGADLKLGDLPDAITNLDAALNDFGQALAIHREHADIKRRLEVTTKPEVWSQAGGTR